MLRSPRAGGSAGRRENRMPLGFGRLISPRMLESDALLGYVGARDDWRIGQSPEAFFVGEILPRAGGGERMVVIDVGANVGQFAVEIARRGEGLAGVCFEPLPAACARLRANLEAAVGLAWRERVEVRCEGVGSEAGVLAVPVSTIDSGSDTSNNASAYARRSASFSLGHAGGRPGAQPAAGETRGVPVVTLDGALAARREEVLLLKTDTQVPPGGHSPCR